MIEQKMIRASRVLNLAEIAEKEIVSFKGELPANVFAKLLPPKGMDRMAPEVYQSHVRERLQQIRDGKLLATDAECALALSEMSLRSPLRHEYAVAYWVAFTHIMPADVVRQIEFECGPSELAEGIEALEDVRRALTRRLSVAAA